MTPTPPSKTTLAKYGLSAEEWIEILNRQGGVCYVCEKEPTTGRLCVDHNHAPGWKKLPPEQRKLHVRGLLCFWCNKTYVGRAITVRKAQRVLAYLQDFELRKPLGKTGQRQSLSDIRHIGEPTLVHEPTHEL